MADLENGPHRDDIDDCYSAQRDLAEEQHNADLLATGDGEALVYRHGENRIRIGNALADDGNMVLIDRERGILHVAVVQLSGERTKLWADIDIDDLRTALQMLGVDC